MAEPTEEKRGEESSASRKLQVFGTIVGLVAFFLGVPSYVELKHKLFPVPVFTSASPSPVRRSTPDAEAIKWRYVKDADAVCVKALTNLPGTGDAITYDWMSRELTARERFFTAWTKVPWPAGGPVDEVYNAEIEKVWADFGDATEAWRQMRADLKARDHQLFNLDLATYDHAEDSFVDGANRFGFQSCNYAFASISPWN